jgi:hypothetical protein
MGSISIGLGSEKDSSMVDRMCNSPEQLFGKEPAYFHGKYCDEIQFAPLKINFEEDFAHDKELGKISSHYSPSVLFITYGHVYHNIFQAKEQRGRFYGVCQTSSFTIQL